MTDEWKPERELIEWAKEHFSQMSVGGVWMPEGSGLVYVKKSVCLLYTSDAADD